MLLRGWALQIRVDQGGNTEAGVARHNVHNFDKAPGQEIDGSSFVFTKPGLFLGNHGVAVFHSRLQAMMVIRRSNHTK